HLASALGTRYALIGMLTERSPDKIRTLAIWAGNQYSPEIEYFTVGTPCENVIGQKLCFYSKDVQKKFPDDQLLVEMKAEAYAGVPLFNAKGDPLGVMAVLHDHPLEDEENARSVLSVFAIRVQAEVERLQAEEKLHGQEARLSAIMKTSVDGIITIDRDGIIESFNPAAERLFGYASLEVIGRNIKRLMPEPYSNEHNQYMQNYMETGNAKIIGTGREVVGLRKDGSTFPMDLGVSEMWIDGKRYFNGTARDITERKVAERKLQEAHDHLEQRVEERTVELKKFVSRLEKENMDRLKAEEKLDHYARELERSNQALQEFSAIASHDLQEPLRKVIAFGDQLRSDYADALDERGLDFLERMQKAALRMRGFIESLLEYSEVGSKPAKFLATDLNLLVREVLSDLEMRIHQTQARIEVGALPTLEVDPLQMRQLFQNLLGNALKFHKPDEPPVISIQSRNGDDSTCKITLKDNGIGFDTQYLDKIFKPFERLHGYGEYEGSGMGLAICKKIVERHNGYLTAESAKGEGSTFILSLPEKKS
ncbi:MAG: PAS domain S-box protein, partial [Nitrospinae bacterium]|nr:PAS domain S-box protein [Nitrospinota bacterium]